MQGQWVIVGAGALAVALVVGSLVEYVAHRLMHGQRLLGRWHAEHHRDGWGQGVWGEFRDYLLGTLPVLLAGFAIGVFLVGSYPAAIGFAAGGVSYAALAAYAHQIQHERPELVFWLPRPVHHLHHKHHMWRHNFGILVDVWDRLLGTYNPAEWQPERRARDYPLRAFFQIKWY